MAPSSDAEKKAQATKTEPQKTEPQKEGLARQDGGSHGRKGQGPRDPSQISKMNWTETVGPSESNTEDGQEEDPGDREEEERDH